MKEQNTHVTYTRSELDALPDETDWERVDALTDEDIEKAALSDPDDPPHGCRLLERCNSGHARKHGGIYSTPDKGSPREQPKSVMNANYFI